MTDLGKALRDVFVLFHISSGVEIFQNKTRGCAWVAERLEFRKGFLKTGETGPFCREHPLFPSPSLLGCRTALTLSRGTRSWVSR